MAFVKHFQAKECSCTFPSNCFADRGSAGHGKHLQPAQFSSRKPTTKLNAKKKNFTKQKQKNTSWLPQCPAGAGSSLQLLTSNLHWGVT
jgi:hypothetical protein